MHAKERDVIVLDEDDDASSHNLRTPVSACLLGLEDSRKKPDQHHQHSTHSAFRYHSVASPQLGFRDLSKRNSTTWQASNDLPPISSGTRNMRGFSCAGKPQLVPQSAGNKTLKTHSLRDNLGPPYFKTPSWSFTAPATFGTETGTPPKPISASHETSGLEGRDSASANVIATISPSKFQQSASTELTDDDDFPDDDDLALWQAQDAEDEMRRSSVTGSDSKAAAISRKSSTIIPRNLPITLPLVNLKSFTYKGIPLAEKVYVELEDKDFLRIVHIIQDTSTSAVTLRGWKFRRTRELNGVIDRKLNEVCWILHVDADDPRDATIQGMETVPVCNIIKRRRIRLTNQSFPALSWREDERKENSETIENDRVLVCRFKYLCFYANAKARAAYEWCEKGFHRLRENERDQGADNSVNDEELRRVWRGYTAPGGSQEGWLPGEKEFLRQEEVSHRGMASRASLKALLGPDFPIGDPMKRGSVGSLITDFDLQRTLSTKVENNDPFVVSSDCQTHDNDSRSALRHGLRQSSIQPRKLRDTSPRIVEIDAHVKSSSSLGTFKKRYEGKVTSKYYPAPSSAQRKRSLDISLGSPSRPTKRIDRGFRAESGKANIGNGYNGQDRQTLSNKIRYYYQELASSDSDRTLGRSQSPDSVEEMYTPTKPGHRTQLSGLPTPVSRRKDSASRRSNDTMLPPTIGGFTENCRPPTPLSRRAQSSVANKPQAYGTEEDDSGVVDLTRPQLNPYGSLSRACSSMFRQSDPSDPAFAHLVISSNERSSRPISTHSPFTSKSSSTSTEMHQGFNLKSPGFLPMTPRSPQVNKVPSPPSSRVIPSSRHFEKSRQQNQNTAIRSPASKAHQRRYTLGDCFCGAGGMSRGGVSAGLRIKWGFDFNLAACQSYQLNFFGTPIYNVWAHQFSEAKGNHKVDICHLSPPCQFFSDAHTIQGKDDDMNTASLFAIFNLLEKAKPRIVTLEQTSGLIRRHPIFFNAVINMFTSRGFSVRWKVMNCADFGLPQRRTRLFIMASCPGEVLPPFPKPTHSPDPEKTGLKPWTTINETIAKIPHGWPNHDIHLAIARDNPPQPGDKIATCITTSGGGIIHPSGKRDYTHREFASLQSFPLGHKFGRTSVKKQVGNAVPPAMAKILLETVRDALLKADGLL